MKKILISFIFLFLMINQVFATTQWRNGLGENSILGTENASDIDSASYNNIAAPLDLLLSNYRRDAQIVYASASTLTVNAGEVMLSNSGGTIRLMQKNTSATTVSWSDIDTGAEAASTTYYLWAFQETVATTTFSVCISTSSTAPSGKTYYRRLGSFYNDSSSNITNVTNDEDLRIASVYDYGTSASSYTNRAVNTIKMCYGTASVSAGSSTAITNLPFTSSSSYVVIYSDDTNVSGGFAKNGVVRNSGSQFTLYVGGSVTAYLNWVAIGY